MSSSYSNTAGPSRRPTRTPSTGRIDPASIPPSSSSSSSSSTSFSRPDRGRGKPPLPDNFVALIPARVTSRSHSASNSPSIPIPTLPLESDGEISVAGSFTRSRHSISHESDLWTTDDDDASDSLPSHHRYSQLIHLSSHPSVHSHRRDSFDTSSHSQDTDWDQELGITESRQSIAALFPTLTLSCSDNSIADSASSPPLHTFAIAPSNHNRNHHYHPVHSSPPALPPAIRGIRANQSVSESWDDDFLFQNDAQDAPAPSRSSLSSYSSDPSASPDSQRNKPTFADRWLAQAGNENDRDADLFIQHDQHDHDELIENWDASFSFGDSNPVRGKAIRHSLSSQTITHSQPKPMSMTPAFPTPSTATAATASTSYIRDHHSSSLQRPQAPGQASSTSRWSFTSAFSKSSSQQRPPRTRNDSIGSQISGITDISARLAAQSDVSSWKTRSSSDESLAESHRASVGTRPSVPRNGARRRGEGETSYGSGDETETEIDFSRPSAGNGKGRTSNNTRSLLASFTRSADKRGSAAQATRAATRTMQSGADSRGYYTAESSPEKPPRATSTAASSQASASGSGAGIGPSSTNCSSTRLSRAAWAANTPNKAANESGATSVSTPASSRDTTMYRVSGSANASRSSIASIISQGSSRSSRPSSPSRIERGYQALRNSRLMRAVNQRRSSDVSSPERSPPASPPVFTRLLLGGGGGGGGDRRQSQDHARVYQQYDTSSGAESPVSERRRRGSNSLSLSFGLSSRSNTSRPKTPTACSSSAGGQSPKQSELMPPPPVPSATPPRSRKSTDPRTTPKRPPPAETLTFAEAGGQLRFGFGSPPGTAYSSPPKAQAQYVRSSDTIRRNDTIVRTPPRQSSYQTLKRKEASEHTLMPDSPAPGSQDTGRIISAIPMRPAMSRKSVLTNSRSVSASTTASASTSSSDVGARVLHKARDGSWNWSGAEHEMYDSETTYGTSVGSESPAPAPAPGKLFDSSAVRHASSSSASVSAAGARKVSFGLPPSASLSPDTSLSFGDSDRVAGSSFAAPSAPSPSPPEVGRAPVRRNSLSDLRIPPRISRAQTGLRAHMSLVREFAAGVEELKVLQAEYAVLRTQVSKGARRACEERFKPWWECAEVLVGLGDGQTEARARERRATFDPQRERDILAAMLAGPATADEWEHVPAHPHPYNTAPRTATGAFFRSSDCVAQPQPQPQRARRRSRIGLHGLRELLKAFKTDPPPQPAEAKLALRPETLPSLMVYVHATRQHCHTALETMQHLANCT